MVKCGIKKYDSLPGRIGIMDIDVMRYDLCIQMKKIMILRKALDEAVILNKKSKRR
jgi:hypothetical protein